jgi:hypothetical protein
MYVFGAFVENQMAVAVWAVCFDARISISFFFCGTGV